MCQLNINIQPAAGRFILAQSLETRSVQRLQNPPPQKTDSKWKLLSIDILEVWLIQLQVKLYIYCN